MFKFSVKANILSFKRQEMSLIAVYLFTILVLFVVKLIICGFTVNSIIMHTHTRELTIILGLCEVLPIVFLVPTFGFLIYFLRKYYRFDYEKNKTLMICFFFFEILMLCFLFLFRFLCYTCIK